MNSLLKWYLKKLIKKERSRQRDLDYTASHDLTMCRTNPQHLLEEAELHYSRGNQYIEALALLDAHEAIFGKA